MTGYTVDDALNGLAAELDAQVAPEFAARVRMAVDEDARRPTARGWIWGLAGLAAAACVAVGMVMMPNPPYVGRAFRPGESGGPEGPPYVQASPPHTALAPSKTVRRSRAHVTPVAVAPTDQAFALNRFLLSIRSGRASGLGGTKAPIDQDGLLLTPDPIEIPLIRISPIQIEPLPVADPDDSSEEQQ